MGVTPDILLAAAIWKVDFNINTGKNSYKKISIKRLCVGIAF